VHVSKSIFRKYIILIVLKQIESDIRTVYCIDSVFDYFTISSYFFPKTK